MKADMVAAPVNIPREAPQPLAPEAGAQDQTNGGEDQSGDHEYFSQIIHAMPSWHFCGKTSIC